MIAFKVIMSFNFVVYVNIIKELICALKLNKKYVPKTLNRYQNLHEA